MNEQTLGNAQQSQAERINTLDPSRRDLSRADQLTDEQLEQLLKRRVDGETIGYVSEDAADEADEDKTLQ